MNTYSRIEDGNNTASQVSVNNSCSEEEALADAQLLFDIMEIIDKAAQVRAEAKCSASLHQKAVSDHVKQTDNANFSSVIFTKYNINRYSKLKPAVQPFANLKSFV